MKRSTLFMFLFLSCSSGASLIQHPYVELELLDAEPVEYSGEQVLRVGIFGDDYPPFDMVVNKIYYDGVNADIMRLVAQESGVKVRVYHFLNENDAYAELLKGNIDAIPTVGEHEEKSRPGIALTPYIQYDGSVVVLNKDKKNYRPQQDRLQIVTANKLLSDEEIREHYPQAKIKRYKSALLALGAVSFGTADLFIGDSISTGFLSNNNIFYNLQVTSKLKNGQEESLAYFAINKNDSKTEQLLQHSLNKMTLFSTSKTVRQWDKSSGFILPGQNEYLNDAQREWLKKNKNIKVSLPVNMPPFSFWQDGHFQGITVDLLNNFAVELGVAFTYVKALNPSDDIRLLNDNEVDVSGLSSSAYKSDTRINYTRNYALTSFVMVVNNLEQQLPHMVRVASVIDIGKKALPGYQQIKIQKVNNIEAAYDLLNKGAVDAVVDSLISANYHVNISENPLAIKGIINYPAAKISFGLMSQYDELYHILNKAILNMASSEVDVIFRKWTNPKKPSSFIESNKELLILISIFVIIALLATIYWTLRLNKCIASSNIIRATLDEQLSLTNILINSTPNPMYIRNVDAELISCNESYRAALHVAGVGINHESLRMSNLLEDATAEDYRKDFFAIVNGSKSIIKDRVIRFVDGRPDVNIYHWMVPYQNTSGNIMGVIGGWFDITQRKQLEIDLQASRLEADKANAAKTHFLATMSHEIRTPLNAIIGMLELGAAKLSDGVVDRMTFDVAYSSSITLKELIGNILDISNVESNKLVIHAQFTRINSVVNHIASLYQAVAINKNIEFRVEINSSLLHHEVKIDELRFRQILNNMVSNAIKFTEKGGVCITAKLVESGNDAKWNLEVTITDTGIGMSAEEQSALFIPFSQVGQSAELKRSGSGLGLVISRRLCEAMGGSITMSSTPQEGTVMTLLFPHLSVQGKNVSTLSSQPIDSLPHACLTGITVMVVDDFYPNIMLLSKQLNYLGYKVIECNEPTNAFSLWQKKSPEIVITDCNMPFVSGADLTRLIRQTDQNTIIIGLTADARLDKRLECIEVGMNECLFKPLSLKEMADSLNKIIPGDIIVNKQAEESVIDGVLGDKQFRETFADHLNQSISNLHDAIKIEDFEEVCSIAHCIKGGARIARQTLLFTLCESLEHAASQGEISVCLKIALQLEDEAMNLD